MGVDPISISVLVAQQVAQAAAAAQAAVASAASSIGIGGGGASALTGGHSLAGQLAAQTWQGLSASQVGGAAGAGAGAGALGETVKDAALKGAQSSIPTAKGAIGSQLAQTAQTAAATAASGALASKEGKAVQAKITTPAAVDASAGLAADAERKRRRPGRGADILTSPLGLSSPKRQSPGVAALTGSLG